MNKHLIENTDSTDSNDSEDYRKLKKYIGIDSDDKKSSTSNENKDLNLPVITLKKYKKIINMFENVGIVVKKSKKKKTLSQFLELCHKQKKLIIKNHIIDMAKYTTVNGYKQLAGTYIIESKNDKMVQKMRMVDKIMEYLNNENYVDHNNNIMSLLNIKQPLSKNNQPNELYKNMILEEFSETR